MSDFKICPVCLLYNTVMDTTVFCPEVLWYHKNKGKKTDPSYYYRKQFRNHHSKLMAELISFRMKNGLSVPQNTDVLEITNNGDVLFRENLRYLIDLAGDGDQVMSSEDS